MADGIRGQGAVRGTVGFARTATDGGRGHGRATDEIRGGRCAGLKFAAELSVHVPASARCPAGFPGAAAKGGAVMARVAVRESVTLAGRAERARAARSFVREVLGSGHPCEDDAVLLVSEVFGNSVRHSGSGAPGETVTVAVGAGDGIVRVEVTDRAGPGTPELRPAGLDAEGGRGSCSSRVSRRGGAGEGAAGG